MKQVNVQLFLLIILALGITTPVTEGCSCGEAHLQWHFCHSEIVIRAKIIGQKIISLRKNSHGEKLIEYKIKLIKMFKGFDKVDSIQYIYTSIHESLCGVNLDAKNKVQYLLSGYMWHRKVVVELCGIVERWDNLVLAQKKNLKYRYQKGCECKISSCYKSRCHATSANECVWFPESTQTLQGVCIKRTNSTCNWYIDKMV
ncbi:metalloproteinase inhibitor 3-like [Clarias gariepinus]|uniref:metalloproteinase inhibitor 3-like n=1 Tax=Clarias gariepinus TaxID=13013 RepID=UPI00234CA2FB|nr:metalloproteinase inhibitor 3-like [Clarias gariepinus]